MLVGKRRNVCRGGKGHWRWGFRERLHEVARGDLANERECGQESEKSDERRGKIRPAQIPIGDRVIERGDAYQGKMK